MFCTEKLSTVVEDVVECTHSTNRDIECVHSIKLGVECIHSMTPTVAGDLIKCSIVCECLCVWSKHCEWLCVE